MVYSLASILCSLVAMGCLGVDPGSSLTHPGWYPAHQHILTLTNRERAIHDLPPLVLGRNGAAQSHAQASLDGGFLSHWDLDGFKPTMRYSRAGGYQDNQENVSRAWCQRDCTFNPMGLVREVVKGWMDSPDHREAILSPSHRLLNVGVAWDHDDLRGTYVLHVVQQFEGDYVDFSSPPAIGADGILSIAGGLVNGATIPGDSDLAIQVYYDRHPSVLTAGQLNRIYGAGPGMYVLKLRPELLSEGTYAITTGAANNHLHPSPHNISANAPACRSEAQCGDLYEVARTTPKTVTVNTRHYITATRWDTTTASFAVEADVGPVLAEYGPGVYEVVVWATLDGEGVIVSEYSLFIDQKRTAPEPGTN